MNSRQKLHSIAVIRIFEAVGLLSKDVQPLNSSKFQQEYSENNQSVWAGKISIDSSSWVLLLYSELDGIKYLATKMTTDNPADEVSALWYFVICGDETEEDYAANKILAEVSYDAINPETGKKDIKKSIIEVSCFDLCGFLKGFEIIRSYMGQIVPLEVDEVIIKKVVEFGKTLSVEECDEDADN